MRWLRTRLLALIAVVAVAAPVYAQSSYLCSMTGKLSDACCCAGKHAEHPSSDQVEQQECCQLIKSELQAAPTAAPEGARHVPLPAAIEAHLPLPLVFAATRLNLHDVRRAFWCTVRS